MIRVEIIAKSKVTAYLIQSLLVLLLTCASCNICKKKGLQKYLRSCELFQLKTISIIIVCV